MPKLVVGLGNVGKEYEKTRHNVGFFIVDRLAKNWNVEFSKKKFQGLYAEAFVEGEKVFLLKPQTLMNLSGRSVAPWLDFLKLDGRDCLVIHDEIDLPLGRMRGQWAGGSGGNRGIASILEALGHPDFCRLRVGIGRPVHREQVASYVLSSFSPEQRETLEPVLASAEKAVQAFVKMGLDPLMRMVNRRQPETK